MKLHIQSDSGVTLIENIFIDRYMPGANGEFVKLYLYLLRCAGTGRELSISSIADFFDHTEKDVRRALSYWEKLKLLKLRYDENGGISEIVFMSGETAPAEAAAPAEDSSAAGPSAAGTGQSAAGTASIPRKRALTPARTSALREQHPIKQILFVGEQYLARPLTQSEVTDILYFYNDLHMSEDLIEYLIEYCASKGNPGARYMEKIALDWYRRGIHTVEEAEADTRQHNKLYFDILRALGITDRSPAATEITYMDRWLNIWGMSPDVVLEACSRTIMQTHQPNFPYIESILKSWKEHGVASLEDIAALDKEYSSKKAPRQGSRKGSSSGKNRFNDFPQREYDFDSLEQQLLNAQSESEE
ncbi:MAG: DnaD domain protein [Lachnospiraceae bacterium]|nr:DnaD domain protein [Lachnospiraceae bacterium]